MKRVRKLGVGCAVLTSFVGVPALAAGPFTENTGYSIPSSFGATSAPYGWLGYNGSKTWELYRAFQVNAPNDLGVTITNDDMQITHATAHNETAGHFKYGATGFDAYPYDGPGLWIGPTGTNQFPTSSQVLIGPAAPPNNTGDPNHQYNTTIRIAFVTTADLGTMINSTGGDGRSADQNNGTASYSECDLRGENPLQADLYYMYMTIDPNSGAVSDTFGIARSAANQVPEDHNNSIAVTQSGTPGPAPYALSARLVQDAQGKWNFVEHVGGWTGSFALPSLAHDTGNLPDAQDPGPFAFQHGTFDPTKVTPVLYAQKGGFGDPEIPNDADLYLTLPGDANLDGKVDFTDLVTLARNYGQSDVGWVGGDFDGSGKVDFSDLVTLARDYGQGPTAAQLSQFDPAFRAAVEAAFAQAPEPNVPALLALAAGGLLVRRRRSP